MDTQERIRQTVTSNPVVLFMKGTPNFPMCGFSGTAVQILKACGVQDLVAVNVLVFFLLGRSLQPVEAILAGLQGMLDATGLPAES